jgi:predicted HTH transcriptional regulator
MIIDSIVKNPNTTADELSVILGISLRKTKANIAKLKARGILERVGAAKGGYWKSIEN